MVKKPLHGPSLYYATDKNIFDALNEYKVGASTVMELFERRNTLVSSMDRRQALAEYFSRLNHDYFDHKEISSRLGVVSRRERVASVEITADVSKDSIKAAAERIKQKLELDGDVVRVTLSGPLVIVHVQYSQVDYRRSEFNQVQVKDAVIEFHPTSDGYVVRSTQNEYVSSIRESLFREIEAESEVELQRYEVSLQAVTSPDARSKFFFDLAESLEGYVTLDVTDVFVFKPYIGGFDGEEADVDTHVERVAMKGTGVYRSPVMQKLTDDEYYVVKIGWRVKDRKSAKSLVYDIEAVFANPESCTDFSFLVVGVYANQDGEEAQSRRHPTRAEAAPVISAIEKRSKELVTAISFDKNA